MTGADNLASAPVTSLIRLIFPNFWPAPTVENFGVRTTKIAAPGGDDRQLERQLDELLDGPTRPRARR